MDRETIIKKLADLIEANPECQLNIDNDYWDITLPGAEDADFLATSHDYSFQTQWYGHSSNYGFGLSEVLIELLNRKGFQITASAV